MNDKNLFTAPAGADARIVRVMDYETTGTPDDEHAEIIEMARIDVDLATMTIGNAWASLAKPQRDIPAITKAVHHITEADVEDAPHVAELWRVFWEGCGPADVCAAHNADFEKHFHHGNGKAWVCTYKCARVIWPDAPSHGNQALRYFLDLDADPAFDRGLAMPPHRALPDAYVTAHILLRLLQEKTLPELVEISKHPALLKRLSFGKHKGMTFEEAPKDYLDWIATKSDLDKDTKFSARYWLKKRKAAA